MWPWVWKASALVIVLILLFEIIPSDTARHPLRQWKSHQDDSTSHDPPHHEGKPAKEVPNYVHFVNLVKDRSNPDVTMKLYQFLAVYSAYHYLQPDKIFIHTDMNQNLIDQGWKNSSDPFISALHKIPNLHINYHTAPNVTSKGKKIDKLPNRSDFVRTDVLRKYGGIFLDEDAYVLRDLKPFRQTGFDMVTGRQKGGQICPAVLLSTPENRLITTYHKLQDKIFDGGWATHATDLLTTLVKDFTEPDYQSLVLPQDTFFPGSWMPDDIKWMYKANKNEGKNVYNNKPNTNMTDFIENFHLKLEQNTWQSDLRLSYVMHGWNTGITNSFDENKRKELFGNEQGDITIDYILSRRSNFGRALYPALTSAINAGILSDHHDMAVLKEAKPKQDGQ